MAPRDRNAAGNDRIDMGDCDTKSMVALMSRLMDMMERRDAAAAAERKEDRQLIMDLVQRLATSGAQQGVIQTEKTPVPVSCCQPRFDKMQQRLDEAVAKVEDLQDKLNKSKAKLNELEAKFAARAKDTNKGKGNHKLISNKLRLR